MNGSPLRSCASWMAIEEAAKLLGVSVVTLRRSIERKARKDSAGTVTARLDGIIARKLGRVWRVWLDAGWMHPAAQAAPRAAND